MTGERSAGVRVAVVVVGLVLIASVIGGMFLY